MPGPYTPDWPPDLPDDWVPGEARAGTESAAFNELRAAVDQVADEIDALEADTMAASGVASAIDAHNAETTSVHGIANTANLETTSGAQTKVDTHVNDSSAAHAASAISIADAGNDFTATDVEGALAELQSDHETDATNLTNHIADTVDAHDASAISFTPTGTISATNVQDALAEVAVEGGSGGGGGGGGSLGEFYVSTTGDDGDDGSFTAPWATVRHAVNTLEAGQTCYIRGGTYTEYVTSDGSASGGSITPESGTPVQPITLKAYPAETPIIVGLFALRDPTYWTIDGIEFTWNPANTDYTKHMVKMTNGHGWTIRNCYIHDTESLALLLVAGDEGNAPNNWSVEDNAFINGADRYYTYFTDGVTNGTTTLTSATASFVNASLGSNGDVGADIVGNGIPEGTTISSVTNSTTVVMSAAATRSGSSTRIGVGRGARSSHSLNHGINTAQMIYVNTNPNAGAGRIVGNLIANAKNGSAIKVAGTGPPGEGCGPVEIAYNTLVGAGNAKHLILLGNRTHGCVVHDNLLDRSGAAHTTGSHIRGYQLNGSLNRAWANIGTRASQASMFLNDSGSDSAGTWLGISVEGSNLYAPSTSTNTGATTASSTTLTSVSSVFTAEMAARTVSTTITNERTFTATGFKRTDVGKIVTGTGIPANTVVAEYVSSTVVIVSSDCSNATVNVTLEGSEVQVFTTDGTQAVPEGTTISAYSSATSVTLSAAATISTSSAVIVVGSSPRFDSTSTGIAGYRPTRLGYTEYGHHALRIARPEIGIYTVPLRPRGVVEASGFTPSLAASTTFPGSTTDVATVQDDPDAPDSTYALATGTTTDVRLAVTFSLPATGQLDMGDGLQKFAAWVKANPGTGSPTPQFAFHLYELIGTTSTLIRTLPGVTTVTSPTGVLIVSAAWSAAELADPTGATAMVRLIGNDGGGSAIDIGAVEWRAVFNTIDASLATYVPQSLITAANQIVMGTAAGKAGVISAPTAPGQVLTSDANNVPRWV